MAPSEPVYAWGRRRRTEAEQRQMAEETGFVDLAPRYEGGYLLVSGRRPAG